MAGLIAATAETRPGLRSVTARGDPHHQYLLGRASQPALLAHRDELVDDHGHRIVARMGIPVAVATVDRDQCHGVGQTAVESEGDCLSRRHPEKGAGVVVAVPVQHHHQRESLTWMVPGRIGDRVAHVAAASLGVEAAAEGRAERCEGHCRRRHGTCSVESVEQLLAG